MRKWNEKQTINSSFFLSGQEDGGKPVTWEQNTCIKTPLAPAKREALRKWNEKQTYKIQRFSTCKNWIAYKTVGGLRTAINAIIKQFTAWKMQNSQKWEEGREAL